VRVFFSEAEQSDMEAAWSVKYNEIYDQKASRALNKPVPQNWQDDKDLIAVRKRILNRNLDKLRGQVNAKISESNETAIRLYQTVLLQANASLSSFVENTSPMLPIQVLALEALLIENRNLVNSQAFAAAPDLENLSERFASPEVLSWGQYQAKLAQTHASLKTRNESIIAESVNDAKLAAKKKLSSALQDFLNQQNALFHDELVSKSFLSEDEMEELQASYAVEYESWKSLLVGSLV